MRNRRLIQVVVWVVVIGLVLTILASALSFLS
jgi:hypothetical protein